MPLSTSIALCTYNGERFLQAQLDSLLAQAQRPDQIVIRDDVSTDRTLDILRAFVPVAEALGIAVDLQVNAVNSGYRLNFDGALRACTGEVIFLCDHDDVWHADKVSRFCAEFDARPDLLALHCDAELIDGDGKALGKRLFRSLGIGERELRRMHQGDAFNLLLKRSMVTGAAMAIRRSVLAHALPIPASGGVHDGWIATIAAMSGFVDTLPLQLICYRIHESNQLGLGGNDVRPRHLQRQQQLHCEQATCADLLRRARESGASRGMQESLKLKARHVSTRSTLPASRPRRLVLIVRELLTGNYHRFGRGVLSAAADLAGR